MNLTAFSVFRPGNGPPQSHNLSLVRKIHGYLLKHLPWIQVLLRSDSVGYNHQLMRYCVQKGIGFVIGGRESQAIFQIIQGIGHWERLRGGRENEVVRFYRKRADAENLIRELKEGYGASHILSEEFLANAVLFQLQLLAYNLVEVFKYVHLDRSWWRLRIKQLRYRLINIAGVVARHARRTVVRLSVHYRHAETFRRIFQLLQLAPVELRL